MANKIDLSQIKIGEKQNVIAANTSAQYQVVLCLSGYSVSLSPLTYRDILKITNSNVSNHEQQKTLFNTIYHKIDWEKAPFNPTFEQFLKSTCYFDYNTLLYGLYCATYPENNKFEITCNNKDCENTIEIVVPASRLIQVFDKDSMRELNQKILSEANTKEKIDQLSALNQEPTAIELSQSKYIVVLREPSMFDVLELLRKYGNELSDSSILITNIMIMCSKILIPNSDKTEYTEINDGKKIITVLNSLTPNDINEIKEEVETKSAERHISYAIKNVKCNKCGNVIDTVDVNIEDILFPRLFEVAS